MKNERPASKKQIFDPGNGKRTPAVWGRWLLDRMGFQRQMLNAMQSKPMYHGTTPKTRDGRAKIKAGRRQRVRQQMARRGK